MIKIDVISGFLGAGKTTLIKKLFESKKFKQEKIVIIENEFGEIGIDGAFLKDSGVQIKENDLLITKDGTVGKIAIVENMPYETSLNSGVLLIRANKNYDNRFLYYVLQSSVFWTWFNMDNSGNSTIIHLYQHNFNNFAFAHPSLKEQKLIVEYLDKKISNLDKLIDEYEQQVNILKKYYH